MDEYRDRDGVEIEMRYEIEIEICDGIGDRARY